MVNQNPQLQLSFDLDSVRCFGGTNGLVQGLVTGGTMPYSYQWSTGDSSDLVSGLSTGQYDLTVSDLFGCTISSSAQLNEPLALILSGNATDPTCFNGSDGQITTSVSGGVPRYAYTWSQGDSTTNLSSLEFGMYRLTVSDRNGCADTLTFILANPVQMIVWFDTDSTSCNGLEFMDATAIAHVRAGQGRRPFFFAINGDSPQADSIFTDLGLGNYTVEAFDNRGCSVTGSFQVFQPPPLVVEIVPDSATIEIGGSIQLNVVINQTGEFSYFWTPQEGLSCSDCPNPVASPFATLDYDLLIEEVGDHRSSCQAEISIRVLVINSYPYFIPNSFTPNGDGFNDDFRIFGENIQNAFMEIFNRIGERVFVSYDFAQGWNGRYKGVLQNPGVYVYSIKLGFLDQKIIDLKGSVTLIR